MALELIQGGVTAVTIMTLVTLFLRFVDAKIMSPKYPLSSELIVNPYFRIFAIACIAGSLFGLPAILKIGVSGTQSELLFALVLCLLAISLAGFLSVQVFLTSVHVDNGKLTTRSPLGEKEVDLGTLRSVIINERFQFELSDTEETIRFCHYIEDKRALIEHIVAHAPEHATRELRKLLQRSSK